MKIGIYSGSFNPIHKGHTAIAEYAITHLGLDKLFFVPAAKNPFKSKEKYASSNDRVNMIDLVKPEKSEISTFEIDRKGISYTIETIKYFKNKFPNDELFLLIGSDNLYKLHKWKNIDNICELSQIVVLKRSGEFSKENIKKYNVIVLENKIFDYSSTNFKKGHFDNVDDKVMKYIAKKYLFINDLMVNMLEAKRHKHSIATGHQAAEFAKQVNYDAKKAWVAGSLHDITKCWGDEQNREYLRSKNIDDSKYENHELHSLTAYIWLKEDYKMEDEEILNSIKVHTSLALELSILDKIVYAADKLSDGRKWEGINFIRETINNDFEKGFRLLVTNRKEDLLRKYNGKMDIKTLEIYNKWG